jgi:hypothetical protein
MARPTVFISYSHKDEKEKNELLSHLGVLEHAGLIDVWNDDQIGAGTDWEQEIDRTITGARVALLLISANFLTSEFILGQELPRLLRRRQNEGLIVFPVIIKACAWQSVEWLRQMNVRPKNGNPVWGEAGIHVDEDLARIAIEVSEIIKKVEPARPGDPAQLFIAYKRHANPDQQLATYLKEALTAEGHAAFIDLTMRTGVTWMEQIDQQIRSSDFLIALLSQDSADSEMLQAEVRRAYHYRKAQGRPHILPVRVAYDRLLPYAIDAFLDPLQYVLWRNEADNEQVVQHILASISGEFRQNPPLALETAFRTGAISEDGSLIPDDEFPAAPLPEFDPRLLQELAVPGGAVRLRDKLYVEREADAQLKDQIVRWGSTLTIRAPRQTGKTSLLVRGTHYAKEHENKVVLLDFQRFSSDRLSSLDIFLYELGQLICRELRLDAAKLEDAWQGALGPKQKLTYFLEDHILPEFERPIILAMDEADSLLRTPFYQEFFALVRAWHDQRAFNPDQWEKLNIVMVISTEPYLLIKDINQSPYNVGTQIELEDFSAQQVEYLNRQHGSPVRANEFPELMTLLGGHPYLTRKALYMMVTSNLTWPNLVQNAATDQGPFGGHLKRHHWGLRERPELKEALKQVIQTNACQNESALFRLLRAGLVKGSGTYYSCRCDLYRRYFEDKLS